MLYSKLKDIVDMLEKQDKLIQINNNNNNNYR